MVSAVQGFKSVDPDMVDLARAMQGSRLRVFCAVNLPHAMPAIFSGLKVSVTLAVVGAVVGEFVGSNSGIGYVMQRSIGTFDLPTMFAALVILALLGVILFWVVDRIERLVIPWHVSQRADVFIVLIGTRNSKQAVRRNGRDHLLQWEEKMMKWVTAVSTAAIIACARARHAGGCGRQGDADAELVRLWRAFAVLLRQGQGHLCSRRHRSRNPGRPRFGGDHAGGGRQDRAISAMSTCPP